MLHSLCVTNFGGHRACSFKFRLECIKCQVSNHQPLGGPARPMADTVLGGGTVRVVTWHVFTCMCLRRTWHEALRCSFWNDSHVDMFGLGLIYLSI